MKKLLFLTLLGISSPCLPVDQADVNKKAVEEANKKLQEEANKKWQEEDNKLARQVFQNKVTLLRKCAKESKNSDEQVRCLVALEVLREALINSKLEITDPRAITELNSFIEETKPAVKKLHHVFQSIDIKEIA